MQVIQGSDFFTKFSSKKIDLFSEENFEINKYQQIEILISAIENEEERDNFFYFYEDMKKKNDFDPDKFFDDLLHSKYSYT